MQVFNNYPKKIEPLILRIKQILKTSEERVEDPGSLEQSDNCLKSSTSFLGAASGKTPDSD